MQTQKSLDVSEKIFLKTYWFNACTWGQWRKWQQRPSLPVPVFLIKYFVLGPDAQINWTVRRLWRITATRIVGHSTCRLKPSSTPCCVELKTCKQNDRLASNYYLNRSDDMREAKAPLHGTIRDIWKSRLSCTIKFRSRNWAGADLWPDIVGFQRKLP